MNTFFVALLLIAAGGVAAPFLCRIFPLMKTVAAGAVFSGCALGCYDAALRLLHHTAPAIFTVPWLHIFTFTLKIDALAAFFLVPVFAIPGVAALYSLQYLGNPQKAAAAAGNYFFYALLIISMALVVCADTLVTFGVAWELMSLSSFFLVIYDSRKREIRQAGYLYFVFTQAGALFIFAGLGVIFRETGSFAFEQMHAIPESAKLVAAVLLLIGCGSKAGIIPFHIWLPHAHPAAPSHVSAVMSGVMIKMGIYAVFRFYLLLQPASPLLGQIILVLGISSGILGVVYALGKHDLKRLLAYHSVENIGIILLGLGIGMLGAASGNGVMAAFGFAGGLLHVLNHAIFKSLLFLGAGAVIQQTGTTRIDQMGGLMKKMPGTARAFLIGSLSISGLPPFNGFISEFLIYYGAFHGLVLGGASFVLTVLAIIALALIGGLAAACFTKVVGIVFLGEPRSEAAAQARKTPPLMLLAQGILALCCLLIGLWPDLFVQAAFQAAQTTSPVPDAVLSQCMSVITAVSRTSILFLLLLFGVVLLRRLLYIGKEVTTSGTWGCGFSLPTSRMQYTGASYADTMVNFFRPFVRVEKQYRPISLIFPGPTSYSTHVHDIFEQGMHALLVRPVRNLLGRLRWIQHGNIQLYIGYIVLTIIVMLFFL